VLPETSAGRLLSPDQFLLTTLIVKLAVMAVLATMVARYRRLLWFAHAAMSMRVLWLFVPCLAAMFVPVQAVSVGGLVGLVATGSGLAVAMTKHKQLARWCPRCPRHGGGGGGGTYALPPLPVTTGSKVRR